MCRAEARDPEREPQCLNYQSTIAPFRVEHMVDGLLKKEKKNTLETSMMLGK